MRSIVLFSVLLICMESSVFAQVQIPDYKNLANLPGANYSQLLSEIRAKFQLKKQELIAQGTDPGKNEQFREELAHFERWALDWRDKIGVDGKFPNPLTGWINAMQQNPGMFTSQQNLQNPTNISSTAWTSIGPVNNGVLNGWTFGGGIGRVNVVKRHPQQLQTLFAGTASGGLFKSTDLGTSWTPTTDQFSGLGVSDLVFLPNNSDYLVMATGDFDGGNVNSIGIFKSIDGGISWTNKLPFTLNQQRKIAHIYVDPDYNTNFTLWATGTFDIYKSTDQGESWTSVYNTGSNHNFNDFVKVGTNYFASGLFGKLFKSTDGGSTWNEVYNNGLGDSRIDFAYSPNTPDILYIITKTNPAFSKYTISTNTMAAFNTVNNSQPLDNNAVYNSQGSYNQVLAVNPLNGNDLMIGEFSGKRSTNGGNSWTCNLNGYYRPTGNSSWGGGYVHSDHHYIEYIGANFDSLLIGNDGGVYIGPINNSPFAFKECVDGLTCTQSYSIAIFDAEPNNLIIGNQDNDGRSRRYAGSVATWYGASAGDGISTAIHRSNSDTRFLSGTTGDLSYRTDGFQNSYSGKSIGKPNDGVFAAPLEMHLTNGNILYGGYGDVYKSAGITPSGNSNPDNANWVSLNAGLGDLPKFIGLSNHPTDATKQRIVAIGDNNVIRKTTDETTWATITPPAGVIFNSIYWSRNSDTMIATAAGFTAANKLFFSANAGGNWTNITDNMPNITMYKCIRYEGTDTVLVATELGVYFARLSAGGGLQSPTGTGWTKYGTGLPNVRVSDMEISYAKKQLFISSYGRGVWMVDLNVNIIPVSGITFSYNNFNAGNYSLSWKIDVTNIVKTVLEKSVDGRTFTTVETFTSQAKVNQPAYLVAKENSTVYYRLLYMVPSGKTVYSQVIAIRNGNDKGINFTLYPNPVHDYVNISSSTRISMVKITTINGLQLTYAQPQSNFYSFDMGLLPKGNYIVQVWDADGKMSAQKILRN
jgi:photosystem II stability/assembly factor-like uncharacterized protein